MALQTCLRNETVKTSDAELIRGNPASVNMIPVNLYLGNHLKIACVLYLVCSRTWHRAAALPVGCEGAGKLGLSENSDCCCSFQLPGKKAGLTGSSHVLQLSTPRLPLRWVVEHFEESFCYEVYNASDIACVPVVCLFP